MAGLRPVRRTGGSLRFQRLRPSQKPHHSFKASTRVTWGRGAATPQPRERSMARGLLRCLLSGGALAALLTTALPAQPASSPSGGFEDPPPDKIIIKVATVNGSGCPQGTTAVAVSEDNTAFTVTYSDYLAQVGGNSDPTAFRKNCQLSLVVHVPG